MISKLGLNSQIPSQNYRAKATNKQQIGFSSKLIKDMGRVCEPPVLKEKVADQHILHLLGNLLYNLGPSNTTQKRITGSLAKDGSQIIKLKSPHEKIEPSSASLTKKPDDSYELGFTFGFGPGYTTKKPEETVYSFSSDNTDKGILETIKDSFNSISKDHKLF